MCSFVYRSLRKIIFRTYFNGFKTLGFKFQILITTIVRLLLLMEMIFTAIIFFF